MQFKNTKIKLNNNKNCYKNLNFNNKVIIQICNKKINYSNKTKYYNNKKQNV